MLRPWNHICKSRSASVSAKTGTSLVGRLLSSCSAQSTSRRRAGSRLPITSSTELLETRQLLAATPIVGLSDEFDDAATTALWQRVNEVEGWNADQLNIYDIDATQSGRMVQQPHTAVWYQNYRGPMAFQTVTGDFAFTTQVHITDRDDIGGSDANDVPGDSQFSLAGAMLRTPRDITDPLTEWTPGSMADDGTNNGENYIFLSAGYGAGDSNEFALEVKTTRNSNSQLELTPLGPDTNTVNVQLARIGNSVIALYQLPGQEWQVHRRYSRPDMPATMQVGLVTYTDWTKANDFDPFTQNSTVLVPGVAGDPTPGEAFNPDLTAGFEYARYVRPDVPEAFAGADLTNPSAVSDAELLSFLGDNTNIVDDGSVVNPQPPTGSISGMVFEDFDGDGVRYVAPDTANEFHFIVSQEGVVDDWFVTASAGVAIDPVSNVRSHNGSTSIAIDFSEAGSAANLEWGRGAENPAAFPRTLTHYDRIRFFAYAEGTDDQSLFIGFNGGGQVDENGEPIHFYAGPVVDVPAGQWTEIVISVDQIAGSPVAISSISFFANSDAPPRFFIDEITLVGEGDPADHQQAVSLPGHPNVETHGSVDPVAPNWGINLFQHRDNSYEAAFVDVVRNWRQWGNPVAFDPADGSYTTGPWEHDGFTRPFTDQGVPTEDFGSYMLLNSYPAGVYRLRYEGTANVQFTSPVDGLVEILAGSVQQDGNVTTLDVQINRPDRDAHPYDDEHGLWVEFLNTDVSNPVRNIQMVAPGYDLDTTQVFRAEFIRRLQPFSTIRFMQWNDTVLTQETTWVNRRLPSDLIQTLVADESSNASHGPAWEFMIAMANEARRDAWITIPHTVDDDYVRELARLWRDGLNSDLQLHVEFSNELWNGQYPGAHQFDFDYQRIAERLHDISVVFHEEWGVQSDRLDIVLAGQAGNDFHIANALSWFDARPALGLASDYIDSISIAPYFFSGLPAGESDVNAILTAQQDLTSEAYGTRQHARIAEAYGLRLNAYEGGISFHEWETTSPDNFIAVQNDTRLRSVYQEYANQWVQQRGDVFVQFQLAGDQFGLLEDMRDPGSVKWDALLSVLLPSGDTTLDHTVTYEDFAILQANYGQGPGGTGAALSDLRLPGDASLRWWEQGDFNGDNTVTAADFDLLYVNLDTASLTIEQLDEIIAFAAANSLSLPDLSHETGSTNTDTTRPSEPGLSGVTIYADLNANDMLDIDEPFSVTAFDGSYFLPDIPAGGYRLSILTSEGLTTTAPMTGVFLIELAAGERLSGFNFAVQTAMVSVPVATVSIVSLDASVSESLSETAVFEIIRSGASLDSALDVYLSYAGTAIRGEDFNALPSFVTIPAGESSVRLTLIPFDDSLIELTETVIVELLASENYSFSESTDANSVTVYISSDDQTMSRSQDVLLIELPAEEGGLAVHYEATIVDSIAATLNAEHNFYTFRDDFGQNWGGYDEKWLQGNGGDYFYVLPSGDFLQWTGSFGSSTLLATLDTSFYTDPALLTTAEPIDVEISVSGNILTINPSESFSGEFEVELTATIGDIASAQTFDVNVMNSAPQVAVINDQSLLVGSSQLIVDLIVNDADGDALVYEIRVEGLLASAIMAEHNLYEADGVDNYAINWGGQNEKWLRGDDGWYFLLPNGTLNQWSGSFESSSQLATFSTDVYDDPQILLTGTDSGITAEVIDGQLVISFEGQPGVFEIKVIVFDGFDSDSTSFSLEVTNTVPELTFSDQSATSGVPLEIALPAVDADGQTMVYTVEVLGDELSALDNEHGFWSDGNYYDNYLGLNERWIRDASNQWHYLLSGGGLYRWNNSFDASPLIASLDSEVYDDPSLLTNPQPAQVTASIENGVLIIAAAEGYVGNVQIRVTASDGFAETATTFQVNVVAVADDDEFESVDSVYSDWELLEV